MSERKFTRKTKPVKERFFKYIGPILENGCQLWLGTINDSGYGVIGVNYRMRRASHLAWEFANNNLIPKGIFVLHKCDNPLCVNPVHLFLGTQRDNITDMVSKKRQAVGSKLPQTKLTSEQVREIRRRYQNGESPGKIGVEFGIGHPHVIRIGTYQAWKHLRN